MSILSRWLIQFCLCLDLTSCIPDISSSFLMTSLLILSSHIRNYRPIYILKSAKKYEMILNLYWSGWKCIVYKLLAYGCLYKLYELGR